MTQSAQFENDQARPESTSQLFKQFKGKLKLLSQPCRRKAERYNRDVTLPTFRWDYSSWNGTDVFDGNEGDIEVINEEIINGGNVFNFALTSSYGGSGWNFDYDNGLITFNTEGHITDFVMKNQGTYTKAIVSMTDASQDLITNLEIKIIKQDSVEVTCPLNTEVSTGSLTSIKMKLVYTGSELGTEMFNHFGKPIIIRVKYY
ncbi:MAG: hypothetical protein B6V02_01980 [Thermoprotei archaeon ex4572_64]|nr:MAG: hypothetical protein B6V02_01980 [Thermoprotei archaeon ex4572_64]